MRITGGDKGGRLLISPEGDAIRPTRDRIRESLFNILAHRDWDGGDVLDETRVLDAFGGTGALGLEALSWGAAHATFFDNRGEACSVMRQNASALGLDDQCAILRADATQPPEATEACDLIFLDPPYKKNLIFTALEALDQKGWIAEKALVVLEMDKKDKLQPIEGFHEVAKSRTYGVTAIYFLSKG